MPHALLRTQVNTATSLKALQEALNAAQYADYEAGVTTHRGTWPDGIDLTSLPMFGGAEPRSTAVIWSWDANNLLVTAADGSFEIRSREQYAQDMGWKAA
jgi:hypothetical protein